MPRTYDAEYHKRYAQSEKGRAARQRARARWIAKRKADSQRRQFEVATLAQALKEWTCR